MRRKAPASVTRPLTFADLKGPDPEAAAIASAVRAIDGLLGVDARGRVLRYLISRYGWTLAAAERDVPEVDVSRQEAGADDAERNQ